MRTPWFDKLDRADDWLAAVSGTVRRRVMAVGVSNWNYAHDSDIPGITAQRARASRLLARAASRREAEVRRLVATAPVPAAEHVVRTRLRDRSEDRTARALARYRDPRPLGRASR